MAAANVVLSQRLQAHPHLQDVQPHACHVTCVSAHRSEVEELCYSSSSSSSSKSVGRNRNGLLESRVRKHKLYMRQL